MYRSAVLVTLAVFVGCARFPVAPAEGGPVWSRDGRFVLATSLLRGAAGNPLFSSVIVIDTRAQPRTARILEDRVGAIARLTPACAAANLDAAALDSDPEYVSELARITAAAIAAQKQ